VSRRVTRRRLRHGLALQLTAKGRLRVVVTLRGPGQTRIVRRITLKAGSRKLMLRPRAAGHGRKLTVVVTATSSDGGRVTLRRTIRVIH
jgi:hypothetical protein